MNAGVISTRYARAIYEYAAEKKEETLLYENMKTLYSNFRVYPALKKVMIDPTTSQDKKIEILITASGINITPTMKQVIRMVVENSRADYMENITLAYDKYYRKVKKVVNVNLITVEPASEKIKEQLIKVISKVTSDKIEFQTETNPDIIGGFILEIEDMRLDASVRDQLNQLRLDLIR